MGDAWLIIAGTFAGDETANAASPVQQPSDSELELDRELEYLAEPEEALDRGVDLGE